MVAVCSLVSWTGSRAQDETTSPEQVMSHGFDCFSCHAINKAVVGPAWITIADHYHHDHAKVPYLAAKIRDGSVGDFGKVPMPAHQDMNNKLATYLANYILSLNGSLEGPPRKYKFKNSDGEEITVDFPVFENYQGRQSSLRTFSLDSRNTTLTAFAAMASMRLVASMPPIFVNPWLTV